MVTEEYNKAKLALSQLLRTINSREMSISKMNSLRKETVTQAYVDKVTIKFTNGDVVDEEDEEDEDDRMEIEPSQFSNTQLSQGTPKPFSMCLCTL